MVAFFKVKSIVGTGHRDLGCIQQEAENSVESETLFKYKIKEY